MPISIADLAAMMDAEGYPYEVRDYGETSVIGCDVATESYRDANGEGGVGLVIDVLEEGRYVSIIAPRAYYLADCPHKAAALEAFMGIQWRWTMVVCEYDSDDGEVRLAVSLPVEDGDLTQRQFLRLLWSIPQFLGRWHSCIVRAMETGIVDFDSHSNRSISAPEAPLLADSVDYDASSRTVRIFISSTFRDFTQERDLLVRKVFPELRRRCRERQVELIDVDLRWGITEAEAEQGKVLPICLTEIDRARPFFMGLLGERYGWVPEAGQFDRSLLIEQPWLEEHAGGKSVTELEILHGVLNNPEMAGRAFFYFRDPAWSQKQGADYTTGSEAERQKLADLKDRIRTSGFPVVGDYADPEALAERVREDLWTLIDAAYPEADVPDPLALEWRRHQAYAASRRRLYLGGERYFEALDAELAAESPRPVLVRGQSGGGKSALVANWLARWSRAHPDTEVIVHHLGCGADAADPVRMAVRIIQEIALLVGEEFKPKSDPEEQLDELAAWLATASAWTGRTGRTVLIVLDGLDKLSDRRHLRWFPTVIPPGVRLVTSCLECEVLEAALPRLPWRELVVDPFSVAEQTQFIGEYLGRFRKQLTAEQTRLLQAHPLVGNPLFLLTVLEELRVFGVHEELDQRLMTLLSPPPSKQPGEEPTVDDAFEHVLARVEADHGAEPVQRVMEAIWASRAGLYTDEILAIAEVPPATWAGIANALDESLYETSGRINFGHDYLQKAVEDRYAITGDTRLALHRRLAEYFNLFEPDARIAEELPWQWREAGERERLRTCLTHMPLFREMHDRDEYELLGNWVWLGDDLEAGYEAAWHAHHHDVQWDLSLASRLVDFLDIAGYYGVFCDKLHQEVIQASTSQFGNDSVRTLQHIRDYAGFLSDKGEYVRAEEYYRESLADLTQVLGENHLDTLATMNDLASLLRDVRRYRESEIFYQKALKGVADSLGPKHPQAIETVHNIACLYFDNNIYHLAQAMAEKACIACDDVFGLAHPKTLTSRTSLATILTTCGNHAAAEISYRDTLRDLQSMLGPGHPTTLGCVENLAILLSDTRVNGLGEFIRAQNGHEEAMQLFRFALAGWESRFGQMHPNVARCAYNLACQLCDLGKNEDAETFYRQALEVQEATLGLVHPSTQSTIHSLVQMLVQRNDMEQAVILADKLEGFGLPSRDHENSEIDIMNPSAFEAYDEAYGELGADENAIADRDDDVEEIPHLVVVPDPRGTIINSIGMKLVPIPAGEFMMGSHEDCPLGDPDEEFQHQVRITRPFLLGIHQVTQSQYERVTGENPSFFKGPDLPVEHLTWHEAQQFCELLSGFPEERAAGRQYRLPAEAEWEYACRAGTSTTFNTGDTLELHQARFATTSRSSPKPTVPVGSYPPNAWGLYDMHGNAWEWTADWFSADYFRESPVDDPQGPAAGTHHTLRGGSASVEAHECRSAARGEAGAADGPETMTGNRYPLYGDFGLRVACDIHSSVAGSSSAGSPSSGIASFRPTANAVLS